MVLCGSYMGFMEKEVLGSKSPLFGRRTGQLHMKPFNYQTSIKFLNRFTDEEKLKLYGAFGGTPLYLQQIESDETFEENIKRAFLKNTSYLYEEPLLLFSCIIIASFLLSFAHIKSFFSKKSQSLIVRV